MFTDLVLDALIVRLPLGNSPILHTGELLEVHRVVLVVVLEPLFEGAPPDFFVF